eukprot:TRINITY_DN266_c0_g2_i1.p1 TRINITY_DN266_c0_g2~~TRINITY_DN266_c0_g2_i1.p1  ORF type:complete len:747 (+),score=106.29 TRINITY_DN266_c0_g2_i1:50-2242(+)
MDGRGASSSCALSPDGGDTVSRVSSPSDCGRRHSRDRAWNDSVGGADTEVHRPPSLFHQQLQNSCSPLPASSPPSRQGSTLSTKWRSPPSAAALRRACERQRTGSGPCQLRNVLDSLRADDEDGTAMWMERWAERASIDSALSRFDVEIATAALSADPSAAASRRRRSIAATDAAARQVQPAPARPPVLPPDRLPTASATDDSEELRGLGSADAPPQRHAPAAVAPPLMRHGSMTNGDMPVARTRGPPEPCPAPKQSPRLPPEMENALRGWLRRATERRTEIQSCTEALDQAVTATEAATADAVRALRDEFAALREAAELHEQSLVAAAVRQRDTQLDKLRDARRHAAALQASLDADIDRAQDAIGGVGGAQSLLGGLSLPPRGSVAPPQGSRPVVRVRWRKMMDFVGLDFQAWFASPEPSEGSPTQRGRRFSRGGSSVRSSTPMRGDGAATPSGESSAARDRERKRDEARGKSRDSSRGRGQKALVSIEAAAAASRAARRVAAARNSPQRSQSVERQPRQQNGAPPARHRDVQSPATQQQRRPSPVRQGRAGDSPARPPPKQAGGPRGREPMRQGRSPRPEGADAAKVEPERPPWGRGTVVRPQTPGKQQRNRSATPPRRPTPVKRSPSHQPPPPQQQQREQRARPGNGALRRSATPPARSGSRPAERGQHADRAGRDRRGSLGTSTPGGDDDSLPAPSSSGGDSWAPGGYSSRYRTQRERRIAERNRR